MTWAGGTELSTRSVRTLCANVRHDLEIIVRQREAFPLKPEESMKQVPKKRFSAGRRVLVGMGMQPATVQSVADAPSTLGEYVHEVLMEGGKGLRRVLGSELQPVPELDEDLRGHRPTIHIENSNVANLNVGSQIGTITANLQAISEAGDTQQQFVLAIEQLTQAIVADAALAATQKQEVVEAIVTISQEAAKKPAERSKVTLKALMTWLPTAISAANGLVTLWDKLGPTIKGYLGI